MERLHSIPPGLYCVPSAIIAATGEDLQSVVLPALNKAKDSPWLIGPVGGVCGWETYAAINKGMGHLGWVARRYKGDQLGKHLKTWARLSKERYPGKRLLISTTDHMLAVCDGLVYDTFRPYGEEGNKHPFSNAPVKDVLLVEKR